MSVFLYTGLWRTIGYQSWSCWWPTSTLIRMFRLVYLLRCHFFVCSSYLAEIIIQEELLLTPTQDGSGWTPLMIAASLKNAEGDPIVDLLLRKGADVNMKSNSGQNALHFATSKSNLSTVRTLLAHKCSARVKDKRGQLPLHRAAAVGSIPILKVLLEEGKSPVNAQDMDGLTAMHHAISEGHGDAAILLLKAGAEPEKRDNEGRLAIELAPDSKVR